jgi:hypothetical protein
MGEVSKAIEKIESYLYTIKRDTQNGWYVLEIGIPATWTYKSTDNIECEETGSTEKMAMIKINPTKSGVDIDTLLKFANRIVASNILIEKKRKDFEKQMEDIKEKLAEQYEKFDDQMESIQDDLFEKDLDQEEVKEEETKEKEVKEEEKVD